MRRKVIQWATGGIGKAAIEGVVDHPDLELVGCWVNNPAKVGKDAGDIAGTRKTGVLATNDIQAILKLDADCVVYSPAFPVEDEIVALLESGKNVVTPVGWFYPSKHIDTARLQAACIKGNSVLHGTGIHPGGFSEKFPLHLTSMQRATSYVRAEEFSDIRTYGAPDIVGEMMGFGKTPDEVASRGIAQYLAIGFYQSIQMVADALQIDIDEFQTNCEFGLATAPIPSPIGPIPPGKVAAMKLTWTGLQKGKPIIEEIVNWYMGEENFDKPWKFGP
ncbi:MAG TPA: dihydrodipicolinate reductase, partial [Spongiibacteraceae bacterium]|nr:dihydrodipicolinate reductase [Spongiibacteraceae bacterium]